MQSDDGCAADVALGWVNLGIQEDAIRAWQPDCFSPHWSGEQHGHQQ